MADNHSEGLARYLWGKGMSLPGLACQACGCVKLEPKKCKNGGPWGVCRLEGKHYHARCEQCQSWQYWHPTRSDYTAMQQMAAALVPPLPPAIPLPPAAASRRDTPFTCDPAMEIV